MGAKRKVTKEMADEIHASYVVLRSNRISIKESLDTIRKDVYKKFNISLGETTIENYALHPFDKVTEYQKSYCSSKRDRKDAALQYFDALTNKQLSRRQMSEETGLSEKTIPLYRSALIKAGLENPKRQRRSSPQKSDIALTEDSKILQFLYNNPSTYDEISEETKIPKESIYTIVNKLKRLNGISAFKMSIGSGCKGNHTFYSQDLIGNLTNKSIVYWHGDEKLVGKKLLEHIPKKLTIGMRRSLSRRLKCIVPETSFKVVYEGICERAVKEPEIHVTSQLEIPQTVLEIIEKA